MHLLLNTRRCSWASPWTAWRAATHRRGCRGRQGRDDAGWAEQKGSGRGEAFPPREGSPSSENGYLGSSRLTHLPLSASVAQEGTRDSSCVLQHPLPHQFQPPHRLSAALGCWPTLPQGGFASPLSMWGLRCSSSPTALPAASRRVTCNPALRSHRL